MKSFVLHDEVNKKQVLLLSQSSSSSVLSTHTSIL